MPIIGNISSAGKKPSTPTIGTATDGGTGTTVSVAFTPSSYIGKGTITYTALSSPGSITATGSGSPITVSGLTTGTAYTFTVKGDTNYGVASDYSSASNSVTPASPNSYESIATISPTTSPTTVTFSSIPSTYKSLQIRFMFKDTFTNIAPLNMNMQFNGVTSASYSSHWVRGNGTGASNVGQTGNNTMVVFGAGTATGASVNNMFGVGIIDIVDYASTSKNKVLKYLAGNEISANNTNSTVAFGSAALYSTSAISSITFIPDSSAFATGTTFALYGVK